MLKVSIKKMCHVNDGGKGDLATPKMSSEKISLRI